MVGQQQDGRSGDGGEPGGQVEEPVQGDHVEQLRGQPAPSSAPAMPITHVMTRPCDLLPGISMLASRPAPRPRTIYAMIPITGLLCCDELAAGLVPDRGRGGLAPPWLRDTLPSYLSPFSQAGTPGSGKSRKPQTSSHRPITSHPRCLLSSGADGPRQGVSCGKAVTPARSAPDF